MEPLKQILYGGDYNPEQWPRETWEEDMRMLKNAHINTLTLNVFSWALLQPDEDTFDFSLLDDIMDLAAASDMHVILATATAAVPPWISAKYPEVMRADKRGVRKRGGGRQNHCPLPQTFAAFSFAWWKRLPGGTAAGRRSCTGTSATNIPDAVTASPVNRHFTTGSALNTRRCRP